MIKFGFGAQQHVWKFFRIGGFDQVRISTAEDLKALGQLDQKLWAALSCPVRGLEFDERTLAMIDLDGDGRIRVPELLAAVHWCDQHLKDIGVIIDPAPLMPLAAINDQTPEGALLLAAAREVLVSVGRPGATEISAKDTVDQDLIFKTTRLNGDGVITAATAGDAAVAQAINDIIATVGGLPDRSGEVGINADKVEAFFAAARDYVAWQAAGVAEAVRTIGAQTDAAFEAYAAVAAKVDDYFVRANLAAFDPRAAGALNGAVEDFAAMAAKNLATETSAVEQLPIAPVAADSALPLAGKVNPAWTARLAALATQAVAPLLGPRTELTRAEWQTIKDRLAPYAAWRAKILGAVVESLGLPRLRELVTGPLQATLTELSHKDAALASEMAAVSDLDRLLRYYRDLYRLLNNFVSFFDFYEPDRWAIFQAGTLYLDGRSFQLCVRVGDMDRHAKFADLSQTYLAYCECARKGLEKFTLAAAITGGDADNLMPGRNGVFYDREGRDWDARIVKIVEHPISIRQAMWTPYKRIGKMIGDQVAKFASDWDKEATARASAGVGAASAPLAGAPAKQNTPFDIAKFAGIFAAIGLALGAIGSALAAVMSGFLKLEPWQMPLVILGIFVLISGPSMLMAALKLRHRNLGPILDANGWAVNGRVKINIPFGGQLTQVATLPGNAHRTLDDPYVNKAAARKRKFFYVLVVLLLAGLFTAKTLRTWPFRPRVAAPAPAAAAPAPGPANSPAAATPPAPAPATL
ncbi:hypothetical protein K0B96_16680 [Horticoccus luteus]|uniref:EF-hand domain-containing protein n=1 Tax=Horticoccus luteus TaxID=2862869 RepID=A0A8F9TW93_9BACT|nr:hypothetical protein [Horticoccus luteus]QYM78918.1 hypothetical protein K0B96_16680 [Horticoccus luteus]